MFCFLLQVDTYIKNGMVVGLGSGQVSGMAIQYLGRQLRSGALHDIIIFEKIEISLSFLQFTRVGLVLYFYAGL